jgi:hypothetical protein
MADLPEGWKTMELGELFDRDELRKVAGFMKSENWDGLKTFLRERKEKLEAKGVLPDYLFYYLQYIKKRNEVV